MVLLARQLNILALGEQEARAVGMRVLPLRMGLLLLASLTTANSVCVSGNIGFVGLVMPHMMRLLVVRTTGSCCRPVPWAVRRSLFCAMSWAASSCPRRSFASGS